MRSLRTGVLVPFLVFAIPAWSQQSSMTTSLIEASRDSQALSLLKQAVGVAGGAAAIVGIADYTATGNITYSGNPQVQGSVRVQGLGLNQCRFDVNLPDGVRSWAVTQGRMSRKSENGFVQPVHSQISMNEGGLVVPYLELYYALNSPAYGVSNKGLTQVNGRSAYDIQVQLAGADAGFTRPQRLADFYSRDYFVDAATFEILMTQDFVPMHLPRQLQYSDFKLLGGVLVPFSIGETVGGQQTWTMQLSQVTFNVGLQDSVFVLE